MGNNRELAPRQMPHINGYVYNDRTGTYDLPESAPIEPIVYETQKERRASPSIARKLGKLTLGVGVLAATSWALAYGGAHTASEINSTTAVSLGQEPVLFSTIWNDIITDITHRITEGRIL